MCALQASLLYRPSLSLFSTPKPSSSIRATRRLSSAAFRSHRRLALFKPRAVLPHGNDKDPILDAEMSIYEVPALTTAADDEASERSGSSANVEKKKESRLPLMALLIGVLESVRRGFYRLATSEWLSWWPFWRQEKRLEMLMAEADANPKDAAKQSALLAELNKHSPESVIRRFEERNHSVDSKGVAEYLRALVVTNALTEYLPDERLGKSSSLPALLQELKQRASGYGDEASLNSGISEKQPLHVVVVDPKASTRSTRFAQEVFSTILFTIVIVVGLMWLFRRA